MNDKYEPFATITKFLNKETKITMKEDLISNASSFSFGLLMVLFFI
jgi:hypothetical protein